MADEKRDTLKRVEHEHEQIAEHAVKLKLFMMRDAVPDDFTRWRMELIWELRDFKNRLLKHFDLEEDGGFMADILELTPHAQNEIATLKQEHQDISDQLDAILSRLKTMKSSDPALLDESRNQMHAIIENLRQHENQEHVLMQRAYFREYGDPS